uniref:VTT domain-containing protein n=1 Tax=Pinguiococcus pyrenoidosus TaxID=172671 RepID=A0A7R9YAN0_9STRA|mmetsp:Transcript_16675/g.63409  ORF Transcript_16675/g.63409 Transcript_16675/m.63409 type:complete len:572 (+) Transcript_16675:315-2030(+)
MTLSTGMSTPSKSRATTVTPKPLIVRTPFGSPRSSVSNRIAMDKLRRQQRIEELRLWKQPLATLYHFNCVVYDTSSKFVLHLLDSRVVKWVVMPLLGLWLFAASRVGEHTPYVELMHFWLRFATWWLGLGILSSIGLGSGIQSGILFLFPHIIKVALTAQECKGMEFESFSDMWFRHSPAAFVCANAALEEEDEEEALVGDEVGFEDIMGRVLPAVLLFGAGTAIGEIPPYVVAKAAAATGKANAELDSIMAGSARTGKTPIKTSSGKALGKDQPPPASTLGGLRRVSTYIEHTMLRFLERNGFWGVFVLAAIPNPAFDLCGIFCGQTNLPFWTFFIATLLGKMAVKTTLQASCVVCAFNKSSLRQSLALIDAVTPDSLGVEAMVMGILEKGRSRFTTKANGDVGIAAGSSATGGGVDWAHIVSRGWALIMISVVLYFVVSCIEQCAHYHVNEKDRKQVASLKHRMFKKRRDSYHSAGLTKISQAARLDSDDRQHKVQIQPDQRHDRTPLSQRAAAVEDLAPSKDEQASVAIEQRGEHSSVPNTAEAGDSGETDLGRSPVDGSEDELRVRP